MPLTLQAVLAAFPFAWAVGVIVALAIAGPDIGALPAVVIPIVLIGAIAFSLIPLTTPFVRRNVMVGGAICAWLVMMLIV